MLLFWVWYSDCHCVISWSWVYLEWQNMIVQVPPQTLEGKTYQKINNNSWTINTPFLSLILWLAVFPRCGRNIIHTFRFLFFFSAISAKPKRPTRIKIISHYLGPIFAHFLSFFSLAFFEGLPLPAKKKLIIIMKKIWLYRSMM